MDSAIVAGLFIYPIKSLDPVAVPEARLLPSGALEHDREFAIVDSQGTLINGKRNPRIHRIRAEYDLRRYVVTLREEATSVPRTYHLLDNRRELEDWLGNFLECRVSVERDVKTGFPDDLESPGPTIISTPTLRAVGSWFGITDERQIRLRFRANVELTAETAFWEDRLFGLEGSPLSFSIGDVLFQGINPCQRCVVPSRNPATGTALPEFQREFMKRRESTLPSSVERSRFTHYYRLAVNTRVPSSEAGKIIRPGDPILLRES